MSADHALGLALTICSAVALFRLGLILPLWNGIKSALLWVVTPRKIQRRTRLQIEFKTDMKWHDVRWSIARLEHELLPEDEWTHDVEDCVDPVCNPKFLRQMRNGKMITLPAPPRNGGVPVLKSPPPPPPPRYSQGGPVKASELRMRSYTCPDCRMTSYNPNDIANEYCGNCHEYNPF